MPGSGKASPPAKEIARGGHFLTAKDRKILDEGPKPWERSDYHKRPSERERNRIKSNYYRVKRKALARARGGLQDIAWLAGSMDHDFLREVFLQLGHTDATVLELLLVETVGKLGWQRAPDPSGDLFAQRLAAAITGGLSLENPSAAKPRLDLVLPATPTPALEAALGKELGAPKPRPGRKPRRNPA